MHHPCFFDSFYLSRTGDGFRPHGGSFCPFHSGGIFFVLCKASYVCRQDGIRRYNMRFPSSKIYTYRKSNRTIGIESQLGAK